MRSIVIDHKFTKQPTLVHERNETHSSYGFAENSFPNAPKSDRSATSGMRMGFGLFSPGDQGECPSTAFLYLSESPRHALKRITPSGSMSKIEALLVFRVRCNPSNASS